jgi:hypothetical protein
MIAVISALVIAFYQSASTKVIGANAIKQKDLSNSKRDFSLILERHGRIWH